MVSESYAVERADLKDRVTRLSKYQPGEERRKANQISIPFIS
jgi:hypothetical protein